MSRFLCFFAVAVAVAVGCGPATPSHLVPLLPGDGNANTAKPTTLADGKSGESDPWAGRSDLIKAPEPKSPSAIKLGTSERFKLKNGLEVIVVPSKRLPVVSMQLAVRAGGLDEERAKVGVSAFAADMLTKGTRARNATKIASTIDFAGGSLSASAGLEASFVSCSVLSKDLGTCLSLLPDVVINPTFPAAEMDTVRKNLDSVVRSRKDSAGEMASAHFDNLLWGENHPRGWVLSHKTVKAITRDDLVAWHKRWFLPNNAVLAIAGDVDTKTLKRDLERAFARWRKGKTTERRQADEPIIKGIKVRLVDKADQTQSHIRIGHLGIAHTSPDFYPVQIFNYALGGGAFSSRLMKVVRSEGGKTYGARSSFDRDLDKGAFTISTFTRTPETMATIHLLLQEMEKMAKSGPTDDEVRDAITNIAGSYSTRFESASDISGALLRAELHGFGEEYVRNFGLKVGAVTADAARRAAQRRLDPSNMVVVVVGKAAEVAAQLKQAGWKFETIDHLEPVADYERNEVAAAKAAPIDAKAAARARTILDRALAAKGGAKRLQAIKALRVEATAEVALGPQKMPASMSREFLRPDKMRMDMKIKTPVGELENTTAFTGSGGWARVAQGDKSQARKLPANELEAARAQLWRDQEFVLLRHLDKGAKLRPKADETIGAATYHVVEVSSADGLHSVTLYINQKSSLLERMSYVEAGQEASETFGDYKVVSGIQIAHRRETALQSPQGPLNIVITVKKVDLAAKIDPAKFVQPAE